MISESLVDSSVGALVFAGDPGVGVGDLSAQPAIRPKAAEIAAARRGNVLTVSSGVGGRIVLQGAKSRRPIPAEADISGGPPGWAASHVRTVRGSVAVGANHLALVAR